MATGLDRVDRDILRLLREDGRMSHAAIAKTVGLSGPAVHDRVRKLEQKGVIAGYSAIFDPEALGRFHVAFVMITLSEGNEFAADDPIVTRICEEPDVLEFHRIAGEDCYLIKTRTDPFDPRSGAHAHDHGPVDGAREADDRGPSRGAPARAGRVGLTLPRRPRARARAPRYVPSATVTTGIGIPTARP
jgi:Lrp/AsnC family leucine-responsive transcriptional regulator